MFSYPEILIALHINEKIERIIVLLLYLYFISNKSLLKMIRLIIKFVETYLGIPYINKS